MNSYDDTLGMPGQVEMNAEQKPVKPSGNFMPGTVKQEARVNSASANTGAMPPPSEMEEAFTMPNATSGSLDNSFEEQATSAFNVLYGMEEVTASAQETVSPEAPMTDYSIMEATSSMAGSEETGQETGTPSETTVGIQCATAGIENLADPAQQGQEAHSEDVFSGMEEVKADGDDLGMPVMAAYVPENNISEKNVIEKPGAEERNSEPQKPVREIGPKRGEKEDGRKRLSAKRVPSRPERKESEGKKEEKPVEPAKQQKVVQKDMGKDDYWLDIIEKNEGLNYFQAEIIRLVATGTDLQRAAKLLERLIASRNQ